MHYHHFWTWTNLKFSISRLIEVASRFNSPWIQTKFQTITKWSKNQWVRQIFLWIFFYWWIVLYIFLISLADLSSVERKVNNGQYTKLCEFIGDVMRIFENCRFFNQPNTSIMKSAQSLETFFSQKLSQLREKVAASWTWKKIQHLSKQEKKNPLCTKCV